MVDEHGENMIVVAPGANGHLTLASALVRAVIAECEVLLLQLEVPIATAVGGRARSPLGRSDGDRQRLPRQHRPRLCLTWPTVTDVVIVNETEEPHWAWPTRHLVVTRGARGATYRGPDGTSRYPAPEVEAIDTTGAGDVFAGVLAAEWSAGRERALRRACAAGALATLVPGAGDCAPTAEAIEDVLTQY